MRWTGGLGPDESEGCGWGRMGTPSDHSQLTFSNLGLESIWPTSAEVAPLWVIISPLDH